MAVDLNQAPEQGSGAGPIPEDSVVVVVAELRAPKSGKEGTVHPMFSRSDSGYEYLDFEFTVVSPKFEGRKMWQNYMLAYTKGKTEKSDQAIGISMRTLRAIVEAHRKISPKDTSPEATKARIINDFSDLNYMTFPIVVGCEWGKANAEGKRYLNNTIKRIVTMDDERFARVFGDPDGCILSDKPLPSEPAAPESPKPAWAGAKKEEPKKEEQPPLPGTTKPKPAWVR